MSKKKDTPMPPHPVDETDSIIDAPTTGGAKLTYQQLKDALFWCWDGFERAGMLFFLVHDTYKQVLANEPLSGDRIEIGVRKLEWISGGKNILDIFLSEYFVKEDGKKAEYLYQGVPIIINIYEDDNCINAPDHIVYDYEVFRIPNSYKRFTELYG